MYILYVKAFHVVFMVTWFAGLFYLPRLFVYHATATDDTSIARFKVMERRLFFGITTPGGILTTFFGLWLLYSYAWQANRHAKWLFLKLALVGVLWLYHIWCGLLVRAFAQDRNPHSQKFYRVFNEVPTLLLIAIVILVIVRPI